MKKIINKVFSHQSLVQKPPVLLDIGASGFIHEKWKTIAPYSICVAFDADSREFSVEQRTNGSFKKLFLVNRIVAVESNDEMDFWLTKSPYCSSTLPPNNKALKAWAFASLFDVEKKITMQSVTLTQSLLNCGIDYVDWYKTDSQGTDLRLFHSLDDSIKNNVIVAEFEPGILDSYIGEDKLSSLMLYMNEKNFWVQNMIIKGSQRIKEDVKNSLSPIQKRFISSFIRTSPGWCEISYMNDFELFSTQRDYLLGWVFAMILEEYGFALELALRAENQFNEPIFSEMRLASSKEIQKGYFHLVGHLVCRSISKLTRKLSSV